MVGDVFSVDRGGKRPGAGRPKGSTQKKPRIGRKQGKRLMVTLTPHDFARVERAAATTGITFNDIIRGALKESGFTCPCKECAGEA